MIKITYKITKIFKGGEYMPQSKELEKVFLKNWQLYPGFDLELVATGMDLPVNIEAYAEGPGVKGKKIVKLQLNEDSTAVKSYDDFIVYRDRGAASPRGLAFSPDGL